MTEELFDLDADPGERQNLAKSDARQGRRDACEAPGRAANVPVTGIGGRIAHRRPRRAERRRARVAPISLRFAGGGQTHRVSGAIVADGGRASAPSPWGSRRTRLAARGARVDVGFVTPGDAVCGFDLEVVPADAPVRWELFLDDAPWPADRVFGGPFGLAAPALRRGIVGEEARVAAFGTEPPLIDPSRDMGLFVTRESFRQPEAIERGGGGAADEMRKLMREWGYAHGPAKGDGSR